MLAKRKMSLSELAEKVGITISNLSILKTGKAKAIRFSTLEKICEVLECQPGDILEYKLWVMSDELWVMSYELWVMSYELWVDLQRSEV